MKKLTTSFKRERHFNILYSGITFLLLALFVFLLFYGKGCDIATQVKSAQTINSK